MAGKLSNFWYYYRNYVIIGVLLLVTAVAIMVLSSGGTEPDIQIGYVTDGRELQEQTQEDVNKYFETVIKDVNNDDKKFLGFVPLMGPRVDLEFSSDGAQIVLVDSNTLQIYKEQGVFEPLDDVVESHGLDVGNNLEVMSKLEGQSDMHIYALPTEKIKYLLDLGFPDKDYYLAVRVEYKKNDMSKAKNENAYSVLEKMFEYKGVSQNY